MGQRDYDAVVRRVEAVSGIDVQILGEVVCRFCCSSEGIRGIW